jgi:hypothetical protein
VFGVSRTWDGALGEPRSAWPESKVGAPGNLENIMNVVVFSFYAGIKIYYRSYGGHKLEHWTSDLADAHKFDSDDAAQLTAATIRDNQPKWKIYTMELPLNS